MTPCMAAAVPMCCSAAPATTCWKAASARKLVIGGDGADIFRFGGFDSRAKVPVSDTNGDVVVDFQHGQDHLDLTGFLGAFATPPAADFLGAGAFTDGSHLQVRSEIHGDSTVVEIWVPIFHVEGPPTQGNANFTLLGAHSLEASDFILA